MASVCFIRRNVHIVGRQVEPSTMSLDIHPGMLTVAVELVSSISIMTAGTCLEYKKLNRLSIALNPIGFIVMAITTQTDVLVLPLLGFVLAISVLVAVLKAEMLYGLFGARTYGALLLAIAVIHTPLGQPLLDSIPTAHSVEEGWNALTRFYLWIIAAWIFFAICAWILSIIVKSKSSKQLADK